MTILITGGTGYIGSHICVELLNAGHDVILMDNLSNSYSNIITKIKHITKKIPFLYKTDMMDKQAMEFIFQTHNIQCVIHTAALKSVSESITNPLPYYNTNLISTLNLLDIMNQYHCKNLIFSSSSTVYGNTNQIPITEQQPKGICTNPYGQTKSMIEQILTDLTKADKDWNIMMLRYFNPAGAHESGLMGEQPKSVSNHLFCRIIDVATKKQPLLHIFGNDYDTPDGTCIRDYIHIMDLAAAHTIAIEKLKTLKGLRTYNIGTGIGYSILDVIDTFNKISKQSIPYEIQSRRKGDVAVYYADTTLAKKELNWYAKRNLNDICVSICRWAKINQI